MLLTGMTVQAAAMPPSQLQLSRLLQHPDDDATFQAIINTPSIDLEDTLSTLLVRLEKAPKSGGLHAAIGRIYQALDRCPEAKAHFEQATSLLDKALVGPVGVAECALSSESWNASLHAFDMALRRTRSARRRLEIQRHKLSIALNTGSEANARAIWVAIRDMKLRDIFVYVEIAEEITRQGQLRLAKDVWSYLYKRTPSDPKLRAVATTQLGAALTRLDESEQAIAHYETALRRLPNEHWSVIDLYEGLLTAHRQAGTIENFAKALQRRKRAYPALLMLAKVYEELGQTQKALEVYRAAARRRPANDSAKQSILRLLKQAGTPTELEIEYQRLANESSADPKFALGLAEHLFRREKKTAAFEQLDRLVQKYTNDPGALESAVDLYVAHSGEKKRIVSIYRRLQRLEPDSDEHAIRLGNYHYEQGDPVSAHKAWKRILRIIPNAGRAHLMLARVLAEHDLEVEAIKEYENAISNRSKTVRYRIEFAKWLASVSRYRHAARVWADTLSVTNTSDYELRFEIRERLVETLHNHKILQAALRKWVANLTMTPADTNAALMVAMGYMKGKKTQRAIRILRDAQSHAPKHVEVLICLFSALESEGKMKDALQVLLQLASVSQRAARPRLQRLSQAAVEQNNPESALKFVSLYAEWAPNDPVAFVQLAEVHRSMSDIDAAAKHYKKAIALSPELIDIRLRYAALLEAQRDDKALTDQIIEVVRRSVDSADVLEAGRFARRLPGMRALVRLQTVLLELAHQRPKQPVYRELLVDTMAQWVRRTSIRGRTAAELQWLNTMAERSIRPLVNALSSQNLGARTSALKILYAAKTKDATPALAQLLREYDRVIQYQALVVLGQMRAGSALPHVLKLVSTNDSLVSKAAIWGLGTMNGTDITPALKPLLRSDASGPKAKLAALALGANPSQKHAKLAHNLVRSGTVTPYAAWALGALHDVRSVELLISQLKAQSSDPSPILWALGAIADQRSVPTLINRLLTTPPHGERLAKWALTRCLLAAPLPRQEIERAYLQLPLFESVSMSVQTALERLMITPPLDEEATNDNYALQATTSLIEILKEDRLSDQLTALQSILPVNGRLVFKSLPGRPQVPRTLHETLELTLIELLDCTSRAIRLNAIRLLAEIGSSRSSRRLYSLPYDSSVPVIRAAIEALTRLETPGTGNILPGLFDRYGSDWTIRLAIAESLRRGRTCPRGKSLFLLGQLLTDEYGSVRLSALQATIAHDVVSELQQVIQQLAANDDDPMVRRSATK
ncbi:MAG: HEAT repeat domain-containing protein, partial [Myxococcota bacterium]|nr:HEAT repeat domain-containing protein [Myxococcota bacterium]